MRPKLLLLQQATLLKSLMQQVMLPKLLVQQATLLKSLAKLLATLLKSLALSMKPPKPQRLRRPLMQPLMLLLQLPRKLGLMPITLPYRQDKVQKQRLPQVMPLRARHSKPPTKKRRTV